MIQRLLRRLFPQIEYFQKRPPTTARPDPPPPQSVVMLSIFLRTEDGALEEEMRQGGWEEVGNDPVLVKMVFRERGR